MSDDAIRYVAFVPEFDDYCECEYLREDAGWFKIVGLLPLSRRLPGETITDERMIQLARSGKKISAFRLYRTKHGVRLLEGKVGVEALLKQAEPGAAADGGGM